MNTGVSPRCMIVAAVDWYRYINEIRFCWMTFPNSDLYSATSISQWPGGLANVLLLNLTRLLLPIEIFLHVPELANEAPNAIFIFAHYRTCLILSLSAWRERRRRSMLAFGFTPKGYWTLAP